MKYPMEYLSVNQLQNALQDVAKEIVASEKTLTEIDTIIGDGDHGIGMKDGFSALQKTLADHKYTDVYELMRESGITLLRSMGGASGVIFGTLFTGGHEVVRGKKEISAGELIDFLEQGAKAIMKRGRSGPGDKTMLDALLPAIESMKAENSGTQDILLVLHAAATGAEQGVKNSEGMLPKTGRSKNFREEALGYPDPGAVSVSIIFRSLYSSVSNL